jgi:hypothetical protein
MCAQVEDLARLSFRRQPLYVGVDDAQDAATREGLEQGYCCVPSAQRFLLLFTFLKRNAGKKARWAHLRMPQAACCLLLSAAQAAPALSCWLLLPQPISCLWLQRSACMSCHHSAATRKGRQLHAGMCRRCACGAGA